MLNPKIVKGAMCHGLWILTPVPELLRGRRMICHPVVLADIHNAGAIFVPDTSHVVVDGDLVTARSFADHEKYFTTIVDITLSRAKQRQIEQQSYTSSQSKNKRVHIVLSSLGFWGEELIAPKEEFDKAGITLHNLLWQAYNTNKLIAAECYGIATLAYARNRNNSQKMHSLIYGKKVTGHPLAYDYTTAYGYANVTSTYEFIGPPIPMEFILRDAVGPDGEFIGNIDQPASVVFDYPFITARSVASSKKCGQKIVRDLFSNERWLYWYGITWCSWIEYGRSIKNNNWFYR